MNSYSRVLIQELADYEKMPDGPKISAETLEEDGFGNETFFRCFVAELNKKVHTFVYWVVESAYSSQHK